MERQIKALDRRLLNASIEIHRLAEVADQVERHPGDKKLSEELFSRRVRLELLMKALRDLPESDLEMLYRHYEAGQSFRQIEFKEEFRLTFKTYQLKNRTILKKMIQSHGSCLL